MRICVYAMALVQRLVDTTMGDHGRHLGTPKAVVIAPDLR